MRIYLFIVIAIFLVKCKNNPEKYRPLFHLTPEKNWVNDPNGLIYLNGNYHVFYQYNPFGNEWGHMSWGHSVSEDLVHWQNLPLAIPEIKNEDGSVKMIFSGSIVQDSLNTSGLFQENEKNGLVAIYTSHHDKKGEALGQSQALAYSSDEGMTWKFYSKNPVLDINKKDFRDPNVFWHKGKWKMVVALPLEYKVQIYESENLKDWNYLSEFGLQGDTSKIWECPSLFEVPVENSSEKKWVMLISSGSEDNRYTGMQYFTGEFDGKRFVADKNDGVNRLDYGKDFYAAIPFNGLKNEAIILGWFNNWAYANDIPTKGFKGGFSLPRKLSVRSYENMFKLIQTPIYDKTIEILEINKVENISLNPKSDSYLLKINLASKDLKKFNLELLKNGNQTTIISFDPSSEKLTFNRKKSGNTKFNPLFATEDEMKVKSESQNLYLEIFVDQSYIEIFAENGQKVMSELVFPDKTSNNTIQIGN